jgi:tetratricopeptide (TPR) repeat protein
MIWVRLGCIAITLAAAFAQEKDAFDLNERGNEASSRGDYVEAQRLFNDAIAIWTRLGPSYEAHLATSQTNLAQALGAVGNRREASRALQNAWVGFRHSLGAEHLRSLIAQNLLAGNLLAEGDDPRAAALFADALAVERRLYPADVQVSRSLSGLSLLHLRAGRVQDALPLAEEALSIALQAEGDSSLDAALAFANVAEVHRLAGRLDRALPLYRKARSLYEKLIGPDCPRVASIISQEGLILMQEGKLSLAEKQMKQSLKILAEVCPGCAYEQAVAETNLGVLRQKQGKYQDADRILTHVVSLLEDHMEKPGTLMASALHSLAQVREKERMHEDAARLQQRADLILAYR